MQVVYFDEVKPDAARRRNSYLIGGLCFSIDAIPALEEQVSELARKVFGSADLVKDTEFHAKDIFHGKANFKGMPIDDRIEILRNLLEIISGKSSLRVFSKIDISKLYVAEDAAKHAFLHFVERLDLCARRAGRSLLIGDLDEEAVKSMINDFQRYRVHGTPTVWGVELKSVVDTVHFAHSHHSRMIQLADCYTFHLASEGRDLTKYPAMRLQESTKDLDLFPTKYKYWPP